MTHDDRTAVVALLERKLDAIAPRDANPVATVVRRACARRRRQVVSLGALALLVAGTGTAAALATGQGSSRTVPPAGITNVRQVADWTGETAEFHGITIPVPAGWTVRRSSALDGGQCRTGIDHTVWLFDVPPDRQWLGDCRAATSAQQIYAVTQTRPVGSLGGANPIALDPSGQPVFQADLTPPSRPFTGLAFPWAGVSVLTANLSDEQTTSILAAVRAVPVKVHPGLRLPDAHEKLVPYQFFGGSPVMRHNPDVRANSAAVHEVLDTAEAESSLRCVPVVGAALYLQHASNDPSLDMVVFDMTGECDQVFDGRGSVARLDRAGLRALAAELGKPGR